MKGQPRLKGLKRLREAKGLTQDMLAQLLGISTRQLCRWETEDSQPREKGMEARICEILGSTMNQLLGLPQAA